MLAASSAAPTFFTPHRIESIPNIEFADGGLSANNPMLEAY